MKTIKDFDLNNKTVILRCDLNVPIKNNKIVDDTRIIESINTIKYIIDHNAKVVILSHLGKVVKEEDKKTNSLEIVLKRLNEYLDNKIIFVPFTKDESIKSIVEDLELGSGILLENTRFEDLNGVLESKCDLELAKYWASLGDIFINDAFGTLHRGHASNLGISMFLDSGIGFLVEKELYELNKLDNPEKPFAVIMGGAKISDKLKVINNLIERVDYLLIGGAMCFTFFKALGYEIGKAIYEEDQIDYCKNILDKYKEKIILPIDFNGSFEYSNTSDLISFDFDEIEFDYYPMDIGSKTLELFTDILKNTKTIFWNGPLGVYEFDKYRIGTEKVLEYISLNVSVVILGGGDIVACATELGFKDKITFASTGGGATLEYLENKHLPGLKNIE